MYKHNLAWIQERRPAVSFCGWERRRQRCYGMESQRNANVHARIKNKLRVLSFTCDNRSTYVLPHANHTPSQANTNKHTNKPNSAGAHSPVRSRWGLNNGCLCRKVTNMQHSFSAVTTVSLHLTITSLTICSNCEKRTSSTTKHILPDSGDKRVQRCPVFLSKKLKPPCSDAKRKCVIDNLTDSFNNSDTFC